MSSAAPATFTSTSTPPTTVIHHVGPYESIQHPALHWIRGSFIAADSLDADRWINTYFTHDATLLFNSTALEGRTAILNYFTNFMPALSSMHHVTEQMVMMQPASGGGGSGEMATLLHECVIHYGVKGDVEVVLVRGVLVAECDVVQQRFKRIRVYLDPAALMQRMAAVHSSQS